MVSSVSPAVAAHSAHGLVMAIALRAGRALPFRSMGVERRSACLTRMRAPWAMPNLAKTAKRTMTADKASVSAMVKDPFALNPVATPATVLTTLSVRHYRVVGALAFP